MSARRTQESCICAEITPSPSRSSACSLRSTGSLLMSARQALDVGAAGAELLLQRFETPVEMIDAVDHRLPFRRQSRDHKAHGGPQIRRHNRRALQLRDAFDNGGVA